MGDEVGPARGDPRILSVLGPSNSLWGVPSPARHKIPLIVAFFWPFSQPVLVRSIYKKILLWGWGGDPTDCRRAGPKKEVFFWHFSSGNAREPTCRFEV